MDRVYLTLFLVLLIGFILFFAFQGVSRSRRAEDSGDVRPKLSAWVALAVLQSLTESELLTKEEVQDLEGRTFEEIEAYVTQQEIFESGEAFRDWVLEQPDIVGSGDSVFGGINRYR